jgi:hypothetical protein
MVSDLKAQTILWLKGDEGVVFDSQHRVKSWADASLSLSGRHNFAPLTQPQLVSAHRCHAGI